VLFYNNRVLITFMFNLSAKISFLVGFIVCSFVFAPNTSAQDLRACSQTELNYTEPATLVNSVDKCPAETVCVTPVAGDTMMCNKLKAQTSADGVEVCPGNPALYSVTTPPGSQTCPIFKKVCYIPGEKPIYVCINDEIQGSCDPKSDPNCPSAKGQECSGGVNSALGCIKTTPQSLVSTAVSLATGLAGGVALMLMVFGAFQMITSSGNAEKLKDGRERFVAAALGLTFVALSILLLQIIGVDILNLPGFSR
jgi:hypothetical protein